MQLLFLSDLQFILFFYEFRFIVSTAVNNTKEKFHCDEKNVFQF